jgi:hypothetical protein
MMKILSRILASTIAVLVSLVQAWPVTSDSPALNVRSEEVRFEAQGINLAGTLYLPRLAEGRRAPAVLILVGPGATPRDSISIGRERDYFYRQLAQHLAGEGFAVLSYDKRCVGASECKERSFFDDYVSDAEAAVSYLRKHPQIDPARIAIFGHSEGGIIGATVAAQEEQKIAALVLGAVPGRTLDKLLAERARNRLGEQGKTEAEIKAYLGQLDRLLNRIKAGELERSQLEIDPNDPLLAGVAGQPEVAMALLINDPLQVIASVKTPVLILQGEKDQEVTVKDAEYLAEALSRTYHPDYKVQLLPDVDHLLKPNKGVADLKSYADTSRPLDPQALKIMTQWLREKLK